MRSAAPTEMQNLENPVPDVTFSDITYSVPYSSFNVFDRKKKEILHGVSGHFKAGEFSAIMGPSGSGKSTLLDIIAGYRKHGYTGQVMINECEIKVSSENSCYIMQEDNLHPLLSVREIMNLSANLKLGHPYTKKLKNIRVCKILDALGLVGSVNTMTGKLSGGQRKRLAIALELLDNPPILYFDEPTSGLDSSSTKQCISLLKKLARDGRIVVCTLHQPSAVIFEMVDYLYCLAGGWCCYSGSPSIMTNFLSLTGLHCPAYHNPADFLMEVIGGEYGNHGEFLTECSKNGKSYAWRKTLIDTSSVYYSSQESECKNFSLSPIFVSNSKKDMIVAKHEKSRKFNAPFCDQVLLLVHRIFLTLMRDKFHILCRLLTHLFIGVLIGIFYFNIGNDAGRVFNNFSLLFFSAIFLAFAALQSMIISFPQEVPIIRREHFNSWYSVKAYYLANTLADFPIQVSSAMVYCTIVYWMSAQPGEWYRFFLFLFMCTMVSLLAQSIGYLLGSSMRVINGVVFGPLSIMPAVMMSGYFIQMRDSPMWSRPFFKLSYIRHCLEGLVVAIYGYSRTNLPCVSEDYCHYVTPKKFLKELDMTEDYMTNSLMIVFMFVVVKIITYFVLLYQIRNKR
ncbi:ATP-binding cassette sub-family G member 1-like [Cimex lectularius]|uniref:ABC transporter domain-containing protein n=1 Tax=Cimex lectularius TaxID=79782 RepID=A0A8I6SEV4_CIMLE|nr:ATP-binding cassette sub-family G member 1-like [Cimex lectularius]